MSDSFAPRRGHHPIVQDRPTIRLTTAEREAFGLLSKQLDRRHRITVAVTAIILQLPLLRAGAGAMVVGSVWVLGWLAVSVPISFGGVLLQGAGAVMVIEWARLKKAKGLCGDVPDGAGRRSLRP